MFWSMEVMTLNQSQIVANFRAWRQILIPMVHARHQAPCGAVVYVCYDLQAKIQAMTLSLATLLGFFSFKRSSHIIPNCSVISSPEQYYTRLEQLHCRDRSPTVHSSYRIRIMKQGAVRQLVGQHFGWGQDGYPGPHIEG